MDITLRPVGPEDEPFLFDLYAATREQELALTDWTPAEREMFLRHQFDAQRTHYAAAYPRAAHSVILADGEPAGRVWVERNDEEIRILDMALLPSQRGRGLGSELIRRHMREAEAAGLPLRHSVERNNVRAIQLYARLGFAVVGQVPTHLFYEYRAAPTQQT